MNLTPFRVIFVLSYFVVSAYMAPLVDCSSLYLTWQIDTAWTAGESCMTLVSKLSGISSGEVFCTCALLQVKKLFIRKNFLQRNRFIGLLKE